VFKLNTLVSAMLLCIVMSFVCWCSAFAQYAQEWRSPDLGLYGWGWISNQGESAGSDIDNDGKPEVLAISKTGAFEKWTYYNGDQGYSVEWTVSSSPYQTISSVAVANLDSDPDKEIIVMRYSYIPSPYSVVGKISIYSCPAHQLEWESPEIEGFIYLRGIADVDNDGINEFCFSTSNPTDSTTYLYVYGYTGEGVKQQNASVHDAEVAYASQNYPNPFNTTTVIKYQVPDLHGQKAETKIEIYNVSGQRIRTLTKGVKGTGSYAEMWDGRDDLGAKVASGVYFYQVKVGSFRTGKKMLMVK